MNNEFDLEPDFDFDELEELDDDSFDDVEDILIRTAVLKKNQMVALLCIKSTSEGAAICRVDPREEHPAVQIYDDPEKALEWFTQKSSDKQIERLASRLRWAPAAGIGSA